MAQYRLFVFSMSSPSIFGVLSQTRIVSYRFDTRGFSLLFDVAATLSPSNARVVPSTLFTLKNCPTLNVGGVRTFLSGYLMYRLFVVDNDLSTFFFKVFVRANR